MLAAPRHPVDICTTMVLKGLCVQYYTLSFSWNLTVTWLWEKVMNRQNTVFADTKFYSLQSFLEERETEYEVSQLL